jgi:hypothetical protein
MFQLGGAGRFCEGFDKYLIVLPKCAMGLFWGIPRRAMVAHRGDLWRQRIGLERRGEDVNSSGLEELQMVQLGGAGGCCEGFDKYLKVLPKCAMGLFRGIPRRAMVAHRGDLARQRIGLERRGEDVNSSGLEELQMVQLGGAGGCCEGFDKYLKVLPKCAMGLFRGIPRRAMVAHRGDLLRQRIGLERRGEDVNSSGLEELQMVQLGGAGGCCEGFDKYLKVLPKCAMGLFRGIPRRAMVAHRGDLWRQRIGLERRGEDVNSSGLEELQMVQLGGAGGCCEGFDKYLKVLPKCAMGLFRGIPRRAMVAHRGDLWRQRIGLERRGEDVNSSGLEELQMVQLGGAGGCCEGFDKYLKVLPKCAMGLFRGIPRRAMVAHRGDLARQRIGLERRGEDVNSSGLEELQMVQLGGAGGCCEGFDKYLKVLPKCAMGLFRGIPRRAMVAHRGDLLRQRIGLERRGEDVIIELASPSA